MGLPVNDYHYKEIIHKLKLSEYKRFELSSNNNVKMSSKKIFNNRSNYRLSKETDTCYSTIKKSLQTLVEFTNLMSFDYVDAIMSTLRFAPVTGSKFTLYKIATINKASNERTIRECRIRLEHLYFRHGVYGLGIPPWYATGYNNRLRME